MRKNIASVIDAFHSDESHKQDTCSTDGYVVRSYDMVIAIRRGHTVFVLDPADSPSRTTSGHIRAVLAALPGSQKVTPETLDRYQRELDGADEPVSYARATARATAREDFHSDG